MAEQLASFTGQPEEIVQEDCSVGRNFTAREALQYGLIDRVVDTRSLA